MNRRRDLCRGFQDERGSVLVVAGMMTLAIVLLATVILEVGHTMEHRRHLQVQVDAAALAAAQDFSLCTTDAAAAFSAMSSNATQYGGFGGAPAYNQQVGTGTAGGTVAHAYQSRDYPAGNHAPDPDDIFGADPATLTCGTSDPDSTKFFDVKATETGIHNIFNFGISSTVNAHARVELKALNEETGLLPLAVPDVRPKFIFATFIDESTGDPIAGCPNTCEEELKVQTGVGNEETWAPDPGEELAVPITPAHIGVRIRFVGADDSTLQCGELYTECYDASSPNGLVHIRGWQTGTAPIAKDVWLQPGTCVPDAYFAQTACNAGIKAMIDLNTNITGDSKKDPNVWVTVDGKGKYPLAPATTGSGTIEWDGGGIPISGDGPHPIELFYGSGNGTSLGVVQRSYIANPDGSGALNLVQVYEPGVSVSGADSFKLGDTHTLGVAVKTIGKLLLSQPADPPIYLRVFKERSSTDASQNQSLDCEPQGSPYNNLKDQIANGCTAWFKTQTALTCPASTWAGIQALPQPWTCVGIKPGASVGQVWQGLNTRIYGTQSPSPARSACLQHPVNWLKPDPARGITGGFVEADHPNDPRVVPLFVTPLGTFEDTGQGVVPLIDFAYFYVTGYKNDPCEGNDPNQDPVPNNRGAYVLGHFVKYFPIDAQHHPSDDNCDLTTITPCVGVLTR